MRRCLVKDFEKRAMIADLLRHPFMTRWTADVERRLGDELVALVHKYGTHDDEYVHSHALLHHDSYIYYIVHK